MVFIVPKNTSAYQIPVLLNSPQFRRVLPFYSAYIKQNNYDTNKQAVKVIRQKGHIATAHRRLNRIRQPPSPLTASNALVRRGR